MEEDSRPATWVGVVAPACSSQRAMAAWPSWLDGAAWQMAVQTAWWDQGQEVERLRLCYDPGCRASSISASRAQKTAPGASLDLSPRAQRPLTFWAQSRMHRRQQLRRICRPRAGVGRQQ